MFPDSNSRRDGAVFDGRLVTRASLELDWSPNGKPHCPFRRRELRVICPVAHHRKPWPVTEMRSGIGSRRSLLRARKGELVRGRPQNGRIAIGRFDQMESLAPSALEAPRPWSRRVVQTIYDHAWSFGDQECLRPLKRTARGGSGRDAKVRCQKASNGQRRKQKQKQKQEWKHLRATCEDEHEVLGTSWKVSPSR